MTWFTIGKVTGVHGLNGNLKVWSFAQSIDTFSSKKNVLLQSEDGQSKNYTILNALPHKKGVLLSLDGVNTRELAENLVGHEIIIDRKQLPEPEENSWYWQDLIGLEVIDEHRGYIGKITEIFPTGANDVLVVIDADKKAGDKETLIPMHHHFVESVDITKKVLTTRLPEDYE
ncbi:MAG: ribosome maturation factor RimM [Pseudomonadota bacterium]